MYEIRLVCALLAPPAGVTAISVIHDEPQCYIQLYMVYVIDDERPSIKNLRFDTRLIRNRITSHVPCSGVNLFSARPKAWEGFSWLRLCLS